jgi:antitoxin component of RelBE/YafQ-DinJ toxin-antitoxin module
MPRKQINIRLPDNSLRQLAALQDKLGMTQVQIVMIALDRLAKQEKIP